MDLHHPSGQIGLIAIDEVHCIRTWGVDFRQQFSELRTLRNDFRGVPIITLTATAARADITAITGILQLKDTCIIRLPLNRPNLEYRGEHKNRSGIIYCTTKKTCDRVAQKLAKSGIKAEAYHAGLEVIVRQQVHNNWKQNQTQVVVATIAFGMGIDKDDVSFVIHYDMPKSPDEYAQQTGRAGRNGQPAVCIMYYTFREKKYIQNLYEMTSTGSLDGDSKRKISAMVDYCEDKVTCRRVLLLRYFGEHFEEKDCGKTCDNCVERDTLISRDLSTEGRLAIALVRGFEEKVTVSQCVDVFRGTTGRKKQLNRNPHYGAGRELSDNLANILFDKLLYMNILVEYKVFSNGHSHYYVKTGPGVKSIGDYTSNNSNQSIVVSFHATGKLKREARPKDDFMLADIPRITCSDIFSNYVDGQNLDVRPKLVVIRNPPSLFPGASSGLLPSDVLNEDRLNSESASGLEAASDLFSPAIAALAGSSSHTRIFTNRRGRLAGATGREPSEDDIQLLPSRSEGVESTRRQRVGRRPRSSYIGE
ncbi:P-loop containing nucleoside triphosphate hydrolase protein, partial [Favolaschia claudopus]